MVHLYNFVTTCCYIKPNILKSVQKLMVSSVQLYL